MKIGAQFYTIHEHCDTLEKFAESIKKVADIGYKYVQISGTCAYDPMWLKENLDASGLKCVITHNPADRLINEPQKLAEENSVFGCDYVGLGGYGFKSSDSNQDYDNYIRQYKKTAETLKRCGKLFMHHNHAYEFQKINGKVILDLLSNDFSADELGFTLDTYWVQYGGGNPAEWIERLSGRVPCIHLKDYAYDQKMAVIGEGNINFDKVFEKAEKAGTKYMLVEQDECYGEDPFECLKRSYEYLKSVGF